jgi:hypothetical protein
MSRVRECEREIRFLLELGWRPETVAGVLELGVEAVREVRAQMALESKAAPATAADRERE